ncbi:hypothetical protein G7068_13500 [Leucobacter viscericola]|uniref:Uncharacterized protein n=1 Tax=Leucobacter viscericola TaxID=2714935 RepID=A0A6G7XI95_9MICO|nr:hypothetical protein [Leucobacter viscericola]QIK64097.1 hypothetical protein G7068_13500 [Leucobacter viscericola]
MQVSMLRLALLGGTAAATALLLVAGGTLQPQDPHVDNLAQVSASTPGNVTTEQLGPV